MHLSKITRAVFKALAKAHHWALHLDCKRADSTALAAFRQAQAQLEMIREAKDVLERLQHRALDVQAAADKSWHAAVAEMEGIKRALND